MANHVDWKTLLMRFGATWRSAHAIWAALQLPSQSRLSWLLGLSAAVYTAARACHDLYKIVFRLTDLDLFLP